MEVCKIGNKAHRNPQLSLSQRLCLGIYMKRCRGLCTGYEHRFDRGNQWEELRMMEIKDIVITVLNRMCGGRPRLLASNITQTHMTSVTPSIKWPSLPSTLNFNASSDSVEPSNFS